MQIEKIFRLFILPFGLVVKLFELSNDGARDIFNKFRFKGVQIDKGCCINDAVDIEENCHILESCLILNCSIKRYTYIGRQSIIQNAAIGSFCSIASNVLIGLGNHPVDLFSTSPIFYRKKNTFKLSLVDEDYDFSEYKPVFIGHDVWIGAKAMILDGVNIGDGVIVAANSVVTKDVPAYAIVAGVPAKVIKYRFSDEKIQKLKSLQWWKLPVESIRRKINIEGL